MDTCPNLLPQSFTDIPNLVTPDKPEWFPNWTDEPCVIIASGPSAVDQPIDLIRDNAKTIVVNNSWRLAPWAEVLYASDKEWWETEDTEDYSGIKISRCHVPDVHHVELKRVDKNTWHDELVLYEFGVVGAGGHGGFQAIDLAYQFGARDIALVGMDMRIDLGVHWHGKHHGKRGNPTEYTAEYWRDCTDRQAPRLATAGARVVNCSPVSTLKNYQKMSLEMWLDGLPYRS